MFSGTIDKTFGWKSKGLSEESIRTPANSENSGVARHNYIHNFKIAVKFKGYCLKQRKVFYSWKYRRVFYYLLNKYLFI